MMKQERGILQVQGKSELIGSANLRACREEEWDLEGWRDLKRWRDLKGRKGLNR